MVSIGLPAEASHLAGFIGALLIVLYLHVVFGEMVPKISVSQPDKALLWLALPLVAIGRGLRPSLAQTTLRTGLCVWPEPRSEVAQPSPKKSHPSSSCPSKGNHPRRHWLFGHPRVLRRIRGRHHGVLTTSLVCRSTTPAEVEREVAKTGFSRYPIVDDTGNPIGYPYLKDVLYARPEQRDVAVDEWRFREMPIVKAEDEVKTRCASCRSPAPT